MSTFKFLTFPLKHDIPSSTLSPELNKNKSKTTQISYDAGSAGEARRGDATATTTASAEQAQHP